MRRTKEKARQFAVERKHALAAALGLIALAGALSITRAAACPPETQVRVPPAPEGSLNIDKVKEALLAYQAENYDGDIAAVFAAARAYVEGRAGGVSKPALVLDIDETSLSNWANIKANNFGFIADGACERLPNGPCGFKAWILQGVAPPIMPALDLFNAAKANGVAVIFITGRRDRERQATLWNRRIRRLGQARHPPRRRPTCHSRSLQDRGTSQARGGRLHDHRDRRRPAERPRRRFR